jgi:hypothetical protein
MCYSVPPLGAGNSCYSTRPPIQGWVRWEEGALSQHRGGLQRIGSSTVRGLCMQVCNYCRPPFSSIACSLDAIALQRHVGLQPSILSTSFQAVVHCVTSSCVHVPAAQIEEHVSFSGWQVSGDLVTLPKNELNAPVVVKRTQVSGKIEAALTGPGFSRSGHTRIRSVVLVPFHHS